ncbi:methyl-accepting chemotaxis protein [Desulforegula conservatrix]|uniref:methyl-accepting chemotaxis protein n=1 Tax=Desulforegula conservatrix TaxID=153026 RepID=UPI00040C7ED1|nr:methyl-accepting chemotaxis protein [Desulforegula conservatrix]
MFNKLSLRQKMQFSICGAVFLAFVITIFYITSAATNSAEKEAKNLAVEIGYRYGGLIKADLDMANGVARTLANTIEGIKEKEEAPSRDLVNAIMKRMMEDNPDCYGVWAAFEPNAFDSKDADFKDKPGSDPAGLYQPYWHKSGSDIKLDVTGMQAENDPVGSWYWVPFKSGKDFVNEPTVFNYDGKDITLVGICIPIKVKGKIIGVAGVDFSMEKFTKLVGSVKPYDTGYGFFISNGGFFVAHPKAERVGKTIKDIPDAKYSNEVIDAIKNGKLHTELRESKVTGDESIFVYTPFTVGRTTTPWCFGVSIPLDKVLQGAHSIRNISILIGLLAILVVFAIVYFIATKIISRPINRVVEGLKDIAEGEGDLTKRLRVTSQDEIGSLATWFNIFMEKLQDLIKQTVITSGTVGGSSAELLVISDEMMKSTAVTTSKTQKVSAAAEEMSMNINSVASAMEEASSNINMVASATEEMTSTINEIAKNSEHARGISERAVTRSREASQKMNRLGAAAIDIGKVTEAINDISSQTDLLALNATIEAARAGEAGKGFAVVAGEIKELSRQTADATHEIKDKIDGIQKVTVETVEEIGSVVSIISEINDIIATIATSVEEQSAATKEIAVNIGQASKGIQEVNETVNRNAHVASVISNEITDVDHSTGEILKNSDKVNKSATKLTELAKLLSDKVGMFKV